MCIRAAPLYRPGQPPCNLVRSPHPLARAARVAGSGVALVHGGGPKVQGADLQGIPRRAHCQVTAQKAEMLGHGSPSGDPLLQQLLNLEYGVLHSHAGCADGTDTLQ